MFNGVLKVEGASPPRPVARQANGGRNGRHSRNEEDLTSRFEEEKLPLFLIKLWNILEDSSIQQIVHWDESGSSFHISDPYSFCRNVLPHYFKHNNLNSMIRQLNMYGFRKMTPLHQGGLTRTESDQDHLEFSHPYFVQGQPGLLVNIKRKQTGQKGADDKHSTLQTTQQNVELIMEEVRSMREKHRNLEFKMNDINSENRQLWDQVQKMRQQQQRQEHVVNKLLQFLMNVVQPNVSKRVNKRGVLAIDEYGSPQKRPRNDGVGGVSGVAGGGGVLGPANNTALMDMIERLHRELNDVGTYGNQMGMAGGGTIRRQTTENVPQQTGPLIAEVTDDHPLQSLSREHSPQPFVSAGSTSTRGGYATPTAATVTSPGGGGVATTSPSPRSPYMGSGVYTLDMAQRQPNSGVVGGDNNAMGDGPVQRAQKRRYPLDQSAGKMEPLESNECYVSSPSNVVNAANMNLPAITDRAENYSPSIMMSPSLDRLFSEEIQDYLSGVDFSIENCRDLLAAAGENEWSGEFADEFGDDPHSPNYAGVGSAAQLALGPANPLELEYAPLTPQQQQMHMQMQQPFDQVAQECVLPADGGQLSDNMNMASYQQMPDQGFYQEQDVFGNSPGLVTPVVSPRAD